MTKFGHGASYIRSLMLMLVSSFVLTYASLASATNNPEALSEMEWSLQPGETVRALAQLIYPKKPHMQKYFIAETIKLNQEVQPDLRPSTVFSQPNVILIPSIKQLSFKYAVSPRR
jgi:hypothetical protein